MSPHWTYTFDLDDTLFAERQYVRSGYQAVAAHLRARLGRTDRFEHWLWRRFCAGEFRGAFDALCEAFDLSLTGDDVAELVEVYRTHKPSIEPIPGAADLLAELATRGRLALLTDGYMPAQRLKLEAVGLRELFDAVVFTEELGRQCWKPSPAGFLEIMRRTRSVPPACVYVADNPAKDFVAPNALGWHSVQLRFEGQVHADAPPVSGGTPDAIAAGLDELREILLALPPT